MSPTLLRKPAFRFLTALFVLLAGSGAAAALGDADVSAEASVEVDVQASVDLSPGYRTMEYGRDQVTAVADAGAQAATDARMQIEARASAAADAGVRAAAEAQARGDAAVQAGVEAEARAEAQARAEADARVEQSTSLAATLYDGVRTNVRGAVDYVKSFWVGASAKSSASMEARGDASAESSGEARADASVSARSDTRVEATVPDAPQPDARFMAKVVMGVKAFFALW